MSPLTLVQEAVKKAVPEIMELKFGCRYLNIHDQTRIFINNAGTRKHRCLTEQDMFDETLNIFIKEILGREIRLSDILRTMKKVGYNSTEEWFEVLGEIVDQWNLAEDSLSWHATHRPKTIDFLVGLLDNRLTL